MRERLKPKQLLIFNYFERHRLLVWHLERLEIYTKEWDKTHIHTRRAHKNLKEKLIRREKQLRHLLTSISEDKVTVMEYRFFKNLPESQIAKELNYRSDAVIRHIIYTVLQLLADYTTDSLGGDFALWHL